MNEKTKKARTGGSMEGEREGGVGCNYSIDIDGKCWEKRVLRWRPLKLHLRVNKVKKNRR